MVKFINSIIGIKVLLFQEKLIIGKVNNVLIDPKDGGFVGLEIYNQATGDYRYIPASEIKGFGKNFVLIRGLDSITASDEVIKIKETLKNRVEVIKSRVFYEDGQYIGRVDDATLDVRLFSLEKLYINPKLSMKFFAESLIIPAKSIVKIEPKKIIIRNNSLNRKVVNTVSIVAPVTE